MALVKIKKEERKSNSLTSVIILLVGQRVTFSIKFPLKVPLGFKIPGVRGLAGVGPGTVKGQEASLPSPGCVSQVVAVSFSEGQEWNVGNQLEW